MAGGAAGPLPAYSVCVPTRRSVALITGGARGIGRATAGLFRARGWDVLVGDIDEEAMATATSAVGAAGLRLDVTDDSSVRAFVRATVDMFGRIDVVVNNAGLVRVAPLLGHDLAA